MNEEFPALLQSYKIITETLKGIYLKDSIELFQKSNNEKYFPITTELVYGIFRYWKYLDFFVNELSNRPINQNVRIILFIGIYQLEFLDNVPKELAVFSTVELAKKTGNIKAKNLVNAILRSFLRKRVELLKIIDSKANIERLSIKYSFPIFLLKEWERSVPYDLEFFIKFMNSKPDIYLKKITDFQSLSSYKGIEKLELYNNTFKFVGKKRELLKTILDSNQVIVQDIGAQIVSDFLYFGEEKLKILDCCSAPGWKSLEVLKNKEVTLYMVEQDTKKLNTFRKITKNRDIFGNFKIFHGKIQEKESLIKDEEFDYLIADVPCSNTGVLRRHPEKKYFISESSINSIIAEQREILKSLYSIMKRGSILIYITCSLIEQENFGQLLWLKNRYNDIEILSSLYLWPVEFNSDGFYMGIVRKN